MHEKIKLPAQEWLGYDPEKGDLHGYTVEQMREFAQLIVQECANICDKIYFDRYPDAEDFERSEEGDAIKKHFGVEE
jgi:hypothetical protein